MQQKIFKLVLTGGPCGGKSSVFEKLKKELSNYNIKIITLNEVSSEFALSGYYWHQEKIDFYAFQKAIFRLQHSKEKIHQELVKSLPYENVLILCDRGLIDLKANMGKLAFSNMISSCNVTEKEILNSYDLIVHLETAAEYYTNNLFYISPEEKNASLKFSLDIDKKIKEAWMDHKEFYVINAQKSYAEKEANAIDLIIKKLTSRGLIQPKTIYAANQ